ncbi:MAG TPA: hypothetical protein VM347_27335, partial [Nonomuraea sp.]|nr:hypothetical protein [Nonomuraea sp.]
EREIRLARQAAGILDGGVGSGGSVGEPAPETNNRTPATPQGLVVGAAAYLDEHGYARGQATVTWSPVTADVNGVALDIDGYEVYARRNQAGELWLLVAQTASGDTTATVSPLVIGWEYAWKVRATSAGVKGVFSDQVVKLVPDDATPPPVPSAPTVTTRLGVIHVAWDGLGAGGVPMPTDFERVRVWMQDPLNPGASEVGYLSAAGVVVIPDQPYRKAREVWLTAVDRSGNESAPTAAGVIATVPLVDTDVIGKVINGAEHIIDGTIPGDAKITADSITGRLIRALEIQAGHIKANAIEADKIQAGAIEAAHISANAVTADKIQANAITAAKIAADAINGKSITGGTITGAYLRTASSGQRIEVAPPGASLPEVRFTSSSGGQASITAGGSFGTGIEIVGSADSFGRRFTLVQSASLFEVKYRYSGSSQANGGFMELRDSGTKVGWYGSGSEDENYFEFSDYGYGPRTTHVGRWNHLTAGPRWGILTGRLTVGNDYGGMRINYPTTLLTVPNPVAGVKHAVDAVPNFRWCLSNNTFSSFDVDWQVDPDATNRTNYGKEVFFWVFRT